MKEDQRHFALIIQICSVETMALFFINSCSTTSAFLLTLEAKFPFKLLKMQMSWHTNCPVYALQTPFQFVNVK